MSSELHKYIKTAIEKKKNLFNSEVLNFPPLDKKTNLSKKNESDSKYYWKINDDSNKDQLKAVTGICFMIGVLLILGLFANITSV
mgnify:FL=1